jgi:hypothetical protein
MKDTINRLVEAKQNLVDAFLAWRDFEGLPQKLPSQLLYDHAQELSPIQRNAILRWAEAVEAVKTVEAAL